MDGQEQDSEKDKGREIDRERRMVSQLEKRIWKAIYHNLGLDKTAK